MSRFKNIARRGNQIEPINQRASQALASRMFGHLGAQLLPALRALRLTWIDDRNQSCHATNKPYHRPGMPTMRFECLESRVVFAGVDFTGAQYSQNFNSLVTSGTNQAWTNESTLTGWSLFNRNQAAIATINADNGGSNTGSFYSYGSTGNTDRALGGAASGGAYFGSPAAGAVAGWIAVALNNKTGTTVNDVLVSFTGEQWRNGGNANTQTMRMEYGLGSTFATVTTWAASPTTFDFISQINTATAGALDGNAAVNRVANLGGSLTGLNWLADQTLWLRWIENNDTGNDHGLAIDDFTFSLAAQGTSTTTTLASVSPTTVDAGQTVTFTGSVVAATGGSTPVGQVEIRNGGVVLASTSTITGPGVNGSFTISTASIPVGSYNSLQAFFVPGSGFSASNSATFGTPLVVNVVGVATTTVLTGFTPTAANTGSPITFNGTITAASGTATPAGTIEIRNNGASGTLLASTTTIGGSGVNGTFSISTSAIPAGSYGNIQAFFVPSSTSFQSSNSTVSSSTLTITNPNATPLSAGDIAVIGYNTSGSPDSFTIVLLRELAEGTTFYVNDNEVTTAGGTSFADLAEAEAAFTVKPGRTLAAGTVITLPWGSTAVDNVNYSWTSTAGAGLGTTNDEIYIYTANTIADLTPTAFVYGAKIGTSSAAIPAGLTIAINFIAPTPTAARYKTTGVPTTGDRDTLLAAIGDTTNNWESVAPVNTTDWTFNITAVTATTTTLTGIAPLTINQGESVTFTGTVVAAAGTTLPVGTIQIRNGTTVLATTTTIGGSGANGSFNISTTAIPEGVYNNVQALFVAGPGFGSSTSAAFASPLTVNRVGTATTTTITSITPTSVTVGNDITFAGTVQAAAGTTTPVGAIEIRDGGASGTLLARTTVIGGTGANGTFSVTSSTVPSGAFSSIQAFFVPAVGFLASSSTIAPTTLNVAALSGPTTLTAGDIAIIGYNTQGTPDAFTILILKTLGPGTVFYINDNEVAAATPTAFTDLNEVEASFTVKAGQSIPAGTVITLPWGSAAVSTTTYDWSETVSAGFTNNNDEIYIYTANAITDTVPTAFIFGVKIGTSVSIAATGLASGTSFISPDGAAGRYKLSGATYTGNKAMLIASIGDTTNNWEALAPVVTSDWTFRVLPSAAVAKVAGNLSFNGGTAQRSVIRDVTINFDAAVTVAADAFVVQRRANATLGISAATMNTVATQISPTQVRLTFTGPEMIGGSLPDGQYDLTIVASKVQSGGVDLDGDSDGNAGGDFRSQAADKFFRLFGDSNGDAIVDSTDAAAFNLTLFKSQGNAAFNSAFDWDGDGDVDAIDYRPLKTRIGRRFV